MTNQIVLKLTVTKRKYNTMSKKLLYGGIEVTPNDPRLPEILASIVGMKDLDFLKDVHLAAHNSKVY